MELFIKLEDKGGSFVDTIRALFYRIRQVIYAIPEEYKDEIIKELNNTNFIRVHFLSIILLLTNILMLLIDVTIYYPRWDINFGYKYLFYAHILLAVERSLYILLSYIIKLKNKVHLHKLKKFMILYSCFFILNWCSFVSINAQATHGQISAFIIGSFCIASAVLLLPKQSFLILFTNSLIFIFILSLVSSDNGNFAGNVINTIFVITFASLTSYINTSLYCKNQIKNKIIQKQSIELEESKDKLEDTVRKRTEELVRTNEELIKEMGIRHDIELQSISTKFLYEENKKLLSEFKEYEELRNVFFANLSHELRTPLNVIFSAQQMMNYTLHTQTCNCSKDKLDKYNKIIKQNCYRLIRLIGNLIDITKIDAKYFEIDKKNCDIVNLIENITQSVADYIKDKNIELYFETEAKQKIIACDPDKIERIMLNLLSNAVKFTPKHGVIKVRLYDDGKYTAISVKDSGIGISKEMQNMIFERFVQADKSTTRNREGSGIGLSLVKSLVNLHQGSITVNSDQGRGSEFIVRLPDILIPYENYIACSNDTDGQNIERINIEFSDIYS